MLDDSANVAPLRPLYEDTDGPPFDFLQGLLMQPHCQAWCLIKGEQPVAAIWYQCTAEQAELIDLRVLASERRQGFGRKLLWASLNELTEASTVELEVRTSNLPARALYQSLGFLSTGLRPAYYPTAKSREDAILMSLRLNNGDNGTRAKRLTRSPNDLLLAS